MVETLDTSYLINLLKDKNKHDTGRAIDVLPFLSKRTKAIRDQFNKVLGEYIRNISRIKYDEKKIVKKDFYITDGENDLSEFIAESVDFNEDEQATADFVRFLDQYLFNQDELNPIHPFLFNYMKLDKKLKNEFGKYAQFMSEALVKDNVDIKNIFNNKDTDDILTELILEKMSVLEKTGEVNNQQQYQPLLKGFVDLYQDDLLFISKYKDYFLSAFPLLTHYYVFMYSIQILLKFEQFTDTDIDSVQPLYFALEWESLTKRRKAAGDLEGYKYIKEHSINLFPHIHTISHLSHNTLNKPINSDTNKISFMPYSILVREIQNEGSHFEEEFLKELKVWIREYQFWAFDRIKIEDSSTNLQDAFKILFNCLREGMSTAVCEKYGKNIDDLGANQFIKNRGSLGPVLNVKHDFLLLMTAVSVKDKRIPLNELFNELEKRGIKFDRHSKKEIIALLDNLNILDKKSDSGDAQYVKPVL
ncbi:DNA phosphorothioation-dependent restriction protein DptG [Bacillus sp. EB01]|uniref:DNA phosphorothioation-dependent restriction protein DptG n=1 Tax=Bacillus sp. EB01 TaxID=1347086 RepID=UPI0005C583B0|nr:DNA phosphorothioation-dependent restriction protein DptG [Bacillus sp. EB01]